MKSSTKRLIQDILSISVAYLADVHERIGVEQPDDEWPRDDKAVAPGPATPAPQPGPATEQPAEAPASPPTSQPEPDYDALHAEAQTFLREISLSEGNDWIINELFPLFSVQSLTELPQSKLQALVEHVKAHKLRSEVA